MYWTIYGDTPGFFEEENYWNYDFEVKRYAVKKLGALGPQAKQAAPKLMELFEDNADHETGDGVQKYRADLAAALALIGDAEYIKPMIDFLGRRATNPSADPNTFTGDVNWCDDSMYYHDGRSCGPVGIVQALLMFDKSHHEFIDQELRKLLVQLEANPDSSSWAKTAVAQGIRSLASDQGFDYGASNRKRNFLFFYSSN